MTEESRQNKHKVDPKLRMYSNGDEEVNTNRAEQAPAVAVDTKTIKKLDTTPVRDLTSKSLPISSSDLKEPKDLENVPEDIYVDVYVRLSDEHKKFSHKELRQKRIRQHFQKNELITAQVPLSELQKLIENPNVISVEVPEQIRFSPPLDITDPSTGPGNIRIVENAPEHEKKVLIGIIDVQGFDFAHPDFLDENLSTRFERIWDQGGNTRPSPKPFGYGAEIKREHMNNAIQSANNPNIGLSATILEPQSQMVPSSHGTHVASIAGGNMGVCPGAFLAGVVISLPDEDMDRRKSFYDSTRIAHAVDYLFELGNELDVPVSINISLGTNGHAHDASSMTSRWIDYELTTAGRSVCIAAGNAGQEMPTSTDDWGFVMGRIHTKGSIKKIGDTIDIEWIVIGDGITDLSENELEIWYNPGDLYSIQVKPPGIDWLNEIKPGEYIENFMLVDGTFISIYNELYRPSNGNNYIACYLSPRLKEPISGIRSGTWVIRLKGLDIRDGNFHGWIERDDPRRLGPLGMLEAWRFPSFLATKSNVSNTSVSSLACGNNIISVANLDESENQINITSSRGPTRDGRQKPEVAAPGTNIIAANGFDDHDNRPWIQMTGTSMASPYVTGAIGLILAANPKLTAPQIGGIIRRTADPLQQKNYEWQIDSGFGRINPKACLDEVERMKVKEDKTP